MHPTTNMKQSYSFAKKTCKSWTPQQKLYSIRISIKCVHRKSIQFSNKTESREKKWKCTFQWI